MVLLLLTFKCWLFFGWSQGRICEFKYDQQKLSYWLLHKERRKSKIPDQKFLQPSRTSCRKNYGSLALISTGEWRIEPTIQKQTELSLLYDRIIQNKTSVVLTRPSHRTGTTILYTWSLVIRSCTEAQRIAADFLSH